MKSNIILISDVINHGERGVTLETHPLATTPALEELLDKYKSQDSDKTVSVSGSGSLSTDSERTPIRVDSQDSQVSDGEPDRGGFFYFGTKKNCFKRLFVIKVLYKMWQRLKSNLRTSF